MSDRISKEQTYWKTKFYFKPIILGDNNLFVNFMWLMDIYILYWTITSSKLNQKKKEIVSTYSISPLKRSPNISYNRVFESYKIIQAEINNKHEFKNTKIDKPVSWKLYNVNFKFNLFNKLTPNTRSYHNNNWQIKTQIYSHQIHEFK